MSACCPTCGLAAPSSTAVGLTAVQRQALQYIEHCLQTDGFSPSYEEIAHALGIKAKSGVQRIVDALIERGHVRRPWGRNRARSLIVVGSEPRRIAA